MNNTIWMKIQCIRIPTFYLLISTLVNLCRPSLPGIDKHLSVYVHYWPLLTTLHWPLVVGLGYIILIISIYSAICHFYCCPVNMNTVTYFLPHHLPPTLLLLTTTVDLYISFCGWWSTPTTDHSHDHTHYLLSTITRWPRNSIYFITLAQKRRTLVMATQHSTTDHYDQLPVVR